MTRPVAALALSAVLLASCAALPGAGRGEPTIQPQALARHVEILSADDFAGREPAGPGDAKTVEYLSREFAAMGLKPGGRDGSWFQPVPLVQAAIRGAPQLAFTVGGARETLTQGEQIAVRAATAGATRVDLRDAPLVFIGYGVTAPERNWDDFKGQDLRGKVGVVLVNDPDFETGVGDFGGKAMTYYGRWTYKYEEARRRGLAGVLIVHETVPASYGWATVKNSNTNAMFDVVREGDAAAAAPIEGWIQRDVAVDLFRRAGLDFEAEKRRAQTRDFAPVALNGVSFSAAYEVDRSTVVSNNVLALLPGTTRADETVLYGAHWDHLGVGAPDARGDRIYNGAIDNATGVAAVLEIARAFSKGPRPERSVVFALWTAEEKGLLGSEYYAENPIYPLALTAAGFNIDAMSSTGRARDIGVIGTGQSDLEDRLARHAAVQGRTVAPDPSPEAGYFFRSDHFPMAKRGVPMLYVKSGEDLLEGGLAAGRAWAEEYRRARYHQPSDEYDPATWNLEGMAEDAQLLYRMGLELARSSDWPNYRPTSEFRPVRDRTADARAGR